MKSNQAGKPVFSMLAAILAASFALSAEAQVPPPARGIPSAPTITSVTPFDGRISVAFSPAGTNGGPALTRYTATCGTRSNSTTDMTTPSPITVSGLNNGDPVTCRVMAWNANNSEGQFSQLSASVTPFGKPGAPTITSVTPGVGEATVSYTLQNNGGRTISSFTATCNNTQSVTSTGTPAPLRLTVTGLAGGTAVPCKVLASNDQGPGPYSLPVNVTPMVASTAPGGSASNCVPGEPKNVVATRGPGSGAITVSFTPPANLCHQIKVIYRAVCGTTASGGVAGANAGEHNSSPVIVRNLAPKTAYVCQVSVMNNGPVSNMSQSVTP